MCIYIALNEDMTEIFAEFSIILLIFMSCAKSQDTSNKTQTLPLLISEGKAPETRLQCICLHNRSNHFHFSYNTKQKFVQFATYETRRNLGQVSYCSGLCNCNWEKMMRSYIVPSSDPTSDCRMRFSPDFFSLLIIVAKVL